MVVSLTGRADTFDLIFVKNSADRWEANVPADLSDGKYLVELYAEDGGGNVTYYICELIMWQGVVTEIHILDQPYQFVILPERFHFETVAERFLVSIS